MKYARTTNNEKVEAAPGLSGSCPACGAPLIAKCGPVKINHWAHKGKRHCDHWWENETPWHREWKSLFPTAWQEVCLTDSQSGEKHIADIRSEHGITVEFQHSFIKQEEMGSREAFYKDMVWVVNGTRLKTDKARFLKNVDNLNNIWKGVIFLNPFPEETFNKNWVARSQPVFFDFGGLKKDLADGKVKLLWCLLPEPVSRGSVVFSMSESDFTENVRSGELLGFVQEVYTYARNYNDSITQHAIAEEKRRLAAALGNRIPRRPRRSRRL